MALPAGTVVAAAASTPDAGQPPPPPPPPIPACEDDPRFDTDGQLGPHHIQIPAADYLGKRPAELTARFGQPDCKCARKWRYRYPRGCSEWRTVITLRFKAGRVSSVILVEYHTGEFCM